MQKPQPQLNLLIFTIIIKTYQLLAYYDFYYYYI